MTKNTKDIYMYVLGAIIVIGFFWENINPMHSCLFMELVSPGFPFINIV